MKSHRAARTYRTDAMHGVTLTRVFASVLAYVGACELTVARADVQSLAGRNFDCLMEARVTIKLGAAVTGLVAKVHVDRGDIVKEGQVVAEMESEVQSAIVSIAKIRASNDIQQRSLAKRSEFL